MALDHCSLSVYVDRETICEEQFENVTNSLISSFRLFSWFQTIELFHSTRCKYFYACLKLQCFFFLLRFLYHHRTCYIPGALIIIVIIFTFKNNLHSICAFMIPFYHSNNNNWKKTRTVHWVYIYFFGLPVHYYFAAVQTSKIICA